MALPAWIATLFEPLLRAVDDLTLSKEEKAVLQTEALKAQIGLASEILTYEGKVIEAQASVIKAEAQGESWLQRNWRPILMLVVTFIVANNYILNPVLKQAFGWDMVLDLPESLWTLMTVGVTGFIVASVRRGCSQPRASGRL